MKPILNHRPPPRTTRQQGISLFIALIALVVLSLAAVALIRSVDTTTLIAGNLAAKQSATSAGEVILAEASTWLEAKMSDPASLEINSEQGFYARITFPDISGSNLTADATWVDGNYRLAQLHDKDGYPSEIDAGGNRIRYLVERMCRNTGPASRDHCLYGPASDNSDTFGVSNSPESKPITTTGDSVLYRVTARIEGPRNTVSYIQSFVY